MSTALLCGGSHARADVAPDRTAYAALIKIEARKAGLPVDIADAVMAIESGYDPTKIGGVGEIGLMQVRPATAAMLGFAGTAADLAKPEVNIRYGVAYLAEAWRKAGGDVCRALMKYRAGHGSELMSPLSVTYCDRARAHLVAVGSTYAKGLVLPAPSPGFAGGTGLSGLPPAPTKALRDAAFWAAHEKRIRALSARIEAKWRRRMASR